MNIPENAKRVFKGILYDVYHWEQRQFDGSISIYEGLKRIPSVQIIAVVEDKLILLDEEQIKIGKFVGVPGGMVEKNDTPEGAAKRELLEETGYECEKLELWFKQGFTADIMWDSYYYIARGCKKVGEQNLDPGEKIDLKLVSFDEFIEKVSSKNFRNRFLANMMTEIKYNKDKKEEFRKLIFE